MPKKSNYYSSRVVIPLAAIESKSIIAETISVPAGAAGTVKDFYFAKRPILDSNDHFIGGYGDSSVSLTSTAFTTEVPASTTDADLANGEYWIDYLTGQGRGKKADTSTSMTATYTVAAPISEKTFTDYEAKSFSVGSSQTNYDVASNETMFASSYKEVFIESDVACQIKLNATGNDSIALAAGEGRTFDYFEVSNIFITTTTAANIQIISFR